MMKSSWHGWAQAGMVVLQVLNAVDTAKLPHKEQVIISGLVGVAQFLLHKYGEWNG